MAVEFMNPAGLAEGPHFLEIEVVTVVD